MHVLGGVHGIEVQHYVEVVQFLRQLVEEVLVPQIVVALVVGEFLHSVEVLVSIGLEAFLLAHLTFIQFLEKLGWVIVALLP